MEIVLYILFVLSCPTKLTGLYRTVSTLAQCYTKFSLLIWTKMAWTMVDWIYEDYYLRGNMIFNTVWCRAWRKKRKISFIFLTSTYLTGWTSHNWTKSGRKSETKIIRLTEKEKQLVVQLIRTSSAMQRSCISILLWGGTLIYLRSYLYLLQRRHFSEKVTGSTCTMRVPGGAFFIPQLHRKQLMMKPRYKNKSSDRTF